MIAKFLLLELLWLCWSLKWLLRRLTKNVHVTVRWLKDIFLVIIIIQDYLYAAKSPLHSFLTLTFQTELANFRKLHSLVRV